jgi:hypothetical protein
MAAAQESVAPFPPPPRYYEEFQPLSNKDWKPPAPPPPIVSCPQTSPLQAHAGCHHSPAAEWCGPIAGIDQFQRHSDARPITRKGAMVKNSKARGADVRYLADRWGHMSSWEPCTIRSSHLRCVFFRLHIAPVTLSGAFAFLPHGDP